jgi:selenocysteine-specific elongation factor
LIHDRLKEEKERGITIDIGFADIRFLKMILPSELSMCRAMKNSSAICLQEQVALYRSHGDRRRRGIMPQSRTSRDMQPAENKIRVNRATKADLVEQEWIELVSDEIKVS